MPANGIAGSPSCPHRASSAPITQHNTTPSPLPMLAANQKRPEAGSEPRVPSRIHSAQIPWVQGCFYKADSALLDPIAGQTGSYLQLQQVICHVTRHYFNEHLDRQLLAVCPCTKGGIAACAMLHVRPLFALNNAAQSSKLHHILLIITNHVYACPA